MAARLGLLVLMLALALACFATTAGAAKTPLQLTLDDKENAVRRIASSAETRAALRCQSVGNCLADQEATCSTPACGRSFSATDGFQCNYRFGNDTDTCGCDGLIRSTTTTVVRFPNRDYTEQDIGEFACFSRHLETDFTRESAVLSSWTYFGHESGGTRIYPGAPQDRSSGSCSNYDPRTRPWYVSATAGPKDVVIIVERSRFMSSTWEDTKCSMHRLLDSFTQNDFITVIGYNENSVNLAGSRGSTGLLRATDSNIRHLKEQLNLMGATGNGFDDRKAINMAFELFRNKAQSSGCPKIIILITEGLTQSSLTNSAISAGQNSLDEPAHIFGLSIFANTGGTLDHHLQTVTCANEGVWAQVRGNALEKLKPYFQFLSLGLQATHTSWTNPYIDAFGLGTIVTVAAPVFDRVNFNPPVVVGVVGTDVLMSELVRFADSPSTLEELMNRGRTCPAFNVDACTLQLIREQTGFVCPSPQPTIDSCRAQREIFTRPCTSTINFRQSFCSMPDSSGTNSVGCCPSGGQCLRSGNVVPVPPPAIPDFCPAQRQSFSGDGSGSSSGSGPLAGRGLLSALLVVLAATIPALG